MNQTILFGRLGKDVELKYSNSGTAIVNMQLATEDRGKDKEGNATKITDWHRLSCFGKTAELCSQYLKKGDFVGFTGKLKTRKYEEKGGTFKYITEILVEQIHFVPKGNTQSDDGKEKLTTKEKMDNATSKVMKDMATKIFPPSRSAEDISKDLGYSDLDCPF